MHRPTQLEGVARVDRVHALEGAGLAVAELGGFVIDVNLFSDLLACITLELPRRAGPHLAAALAARGVALDAASAARLEALGPDGAEIEATLALSFPAGTGELRHVRPAVPG